MPADSSPRGCFYLLGNRLCIDFANSVVARAAGDPLGNWKDFLDFLEIAGALNHFEAGVLLAIGKDQPRAVRETLQHAGSLRLSCRLVPLFSGNCWVRGRFLPCNQ